MCHRKQPIYDPYIFHDTTTASDSPIQNPFTRSTREKFMKHRIQGALIDIHFFTKKKIADRETAAGRPTYSRTSTTCNRVCAFIISPSSIMILLYSEI